MKKLLSAFIGKLKKLGGWKLWAVGGFSAGLGMGTLELLARGIITVDQAKKIVLFVLTLGA